MENKHFSIFLIIILVSLLSAIFFLSKCKRETSLAQQAESQAALVLTDAPLAPSNLDQEFSLNLNSGDKFDLFVYLYPQGKPIAATDVEISFDPQVIEVLGKTVGNLFPTYVEPVGKGYLDQQNGKISLSGVAFDKQTNKPTDPISSLGEFAKFNLRVKNGLGSQVSQISFDPEVVDPQNNLTTDSNIINLSGSNGDPEDILGKVNIFKLIINQQGDINGDSQVDISDFYLVARYYGLKNDFELRVDTNRDGEVDIQDFYQISRNYGNVY